MKPTVTKLIDLLNKPALLKWANKIGLEGVSLDDYRKKSAKKGTSLHNQIENFILNGVDFENEKYQEKFLKLIEDKEILSVEENIENEWFKGRLDCRLKIEGVSYVVDFKSSKNVYFEQKLQLAAYKMCYPDHEVAIVSIPDFKFKIVSIDFKRMELILKCLSKIYELKNAL